MSKLRVYKIGALDLQSNPLLLEDGTLIRGVNVDSYPIGGKRKRAGYVPYLSAVPNGSTIVDMFSFYPNNGTQFWNYAFAGGNLYYSTQGTGAWTQTGNGTLSPVGTMTHAVLANTLMIGDGVSATRHSTDGTNFVNTVAAPVAVSLEEFQTRIYAAGTNSTLFYSTVGTPTDWVTDSVSFPIPGAGGLQSIYNSANRLVINKNSGRIFRWDGDNLVDLATNYGPTSGRSIGNIEGIRLYSNRTGIYSYDGNQPKLLSNVVERQFYNDAGLGIPGSYASSLQGQGFQYKYFLNANGVAASGTVTDDLTSQPVNNLVFTYDIQLNEFLNYSLFDAPTAFLNYVDVNGVQQLAFGAGANSFLFSGTATSDNGNPIASVMQGVVHAKTPESDKEWKYLWASFNPGAQARMQVALCDTFTKGKLNWVDLGDCSDGIVEFRFPTNLFPDGARSKLLMWRVTDNSANDRFIFYGFGIEATIIDRQ